MSLNGGISQSVWYEQIAAEFIKYEWLSYSGPPNKKVVGEMNKAYMEIAKTFSIANIQSVKMEISNMKKYVNRVMRRCVRVSIINGGGGEDALNYAPHWFKALDQRLKLLHLACKMEKLHSLKHYNTGKRVSHFTSEIVRCACRAAARELARDSTDEDASEPPRDRTSGGVSGINGAVRDLDRYNAIERVSDFDGTERAARAANTLVSKDAVREFAENVDTAVDGLHSIWVRIYAQSIHKLMSLIASGDQASERYAPIEWLAADAGLLYDTRLMVVVDKTFQSSVTLNPLILLYKLMVAAHEKIKEMKTLPNLTTQNGFQNIIGAQTGTQENSNINIPSSSNNSIPDEDISERNSDSEMRVDGNISNELETKSARDINERERARHIWALVHINYILSGRSSSAVLLQRRWHEMKQRTRQLLTGKNAPLAPPPLLLALAKQFPCILTEKLPPWSELVLGNLIYQDSELEPYRRLYTGILLEVPKEIGENLIFDDLHDWSDDEVEVINENRETIIITDSDDEETDKGTNVQTDTSVNNIKIDSDDELDSIKKLESIDLTKAKVKIIFENDSDDDLNAFINGGNEPDTSKITNSNVKLNVFEGSDLKCREIIFESDETDSDENILNTNHKLLEETQTSKLNNIKKNEGDKVNVRNSVSNEIETKGRPDNHDQNVDIDMDEVISELRTKLVKGPFNVSNKVTQTEDILQNDPTSKVGAVDDENISDDFEESQSGDERCNDGDESSSDDEGGRPDPLLVDEKLVQLSHVVLTLIEDIPDWRKHSRNNVIKCRQFSVKNFSKKVHVTSKQLKKCRPYIPKKSTNGIWIRKNEELRQIPKDIKKKINVLSKRLNLSRTYFSRDFWSERNLGLVELCKPFSIQLNMIPRVIKKIELADMDEVRRMNRTILTAQVAPITVGANRMFVIDSSAPSTTAKRIQHRPRYSSTDDESPLYKYETREKNLPSNLTRVQENEKISDSVEEDLPKPNLLKDNTPKNLDSNLEKDESPSESDIKEMIKTIVRKGDLPKASETSYLVEKQDSNYSSKQKELERDLRQISKVLLRCLDSTKSETPNKRNHKKKVKTEPEPIPKQETLNSLEEWKRQKQQNLIYFNFNTNLEVKKSDKNVNQYTNKKKKHKRDQSDVNNGNSEVNLHKENEASESKDTVENSDSSDCSEKVIKRKNCESLSEAPVKYPKLEMNDEAIPFKNPRLEMNEEPIIEPPDVIEVSDDSNDSDIKVKPSVLSYINTKSLNNQYKSQININVVQNTIQINGCGSSDEKINENNTEVISLLSKVAGCIQKNRAPASPQNNDAFYVVECSKSNSTKTLIDTNAQDTVIKTKSASNSMYYMVNVPDHLTGSNKTLISPLPDSPGQMPVIQSVSSLSQLSQRSLNQMSSDVIDLNQASLNQRPAIIDLNQASLNQRPAIIQSNQESLNQRPAIIDSNQVSLNQRPAIIDSNQVSLNQKRPLFYICQPSPYQTSPSIDLNQPSLNQIRPQNQMSVYPNQVVTVSALPNQTCHKQINAANHTIVGNAFENLVKRPSNNKFRNTNPVPVRIAPMPLIQSVSSLRQMEQQNIPKEY